MTVDAPALDLDAGLWLTISDIARRKGKSKQAISKRVKALIEAGLLQTKPGEKNTTLVNLAQFDRAVGQVGDAAKEQAAATRSAAKVEAPQDPPGDGEGGPDYREHQAREKQYAADLKFLELQERLGNLVQVSDLADQANKCAEVLVRVFDRLPTFADQMAASVGKDGAAGARASFKEIARDLRTAAADAFRDLIGTAEAQEVAQAD
ncbi:winged helix-turn-helix domain-containing protein [Bradyrhizobium sp. SZCCHNS2015]|uniref:winged helix-turn-helix domain-containing protein n=1 Tax=Bradyrhizobium sp. SZCCHNS2015 TaxID=3057305 RepID=UPI0028EB5730|nr:winged helix-turn-helix domain-containing protein [Bradyrhizobium sp. SZCCHNS2015]